MTIQDQALTVLYAAIDQENEILPPNKQLAKSPDTALFGETGGLSSLELVSLIATVEQIAQDEFNIPVTLVDERALSQEASPFQSVATLSGYLAAIVEEGSA